MSHEATTDSPLLVKTFEHMDVAPPKELIPGTGIYLLESEMPHNKNGHMFVVGGETIIDTGSYGELGRLEIGLERLGLCLSDIEHILVTDIHADHIGGAGEIKSRTRARIIVPNGYGEIIRSSTDLESLTCQNIYPHMKGLSPSEWLPSDFNEAINGEPITLENYEITPYSLPGHGPLTTGYLVEVDGLKLFVLGDAFNGGYNEEMIRSNSEQWEMSINKIISIDFDYCTDGHSPKSSQPFTKERLVSASHSFLQNLKRKKPNGEFRRLALYWYEHQVSSSAP